MAQHHRNISGFSILLNFPFPFLSLFFFQILFFFFFFSIPGIWNLSASNHETNRSRNDTSSLPREQEGAISLNIETENTSNDKVKLLVVRILSPLFLFIFPSFWWRETILCLFLQIFLIFKGINPDL